MTFASGDISCECDECGLSNDVPLLLLPLERERERERERSEALLYIICIDAGIFWFHQRVGDILIGE